MGDVFKLEEVQEDRTEQSSVDKAGFELLRVGLRALSQRALVALASLFTLLTVGSVFWLFMTMHDPNTMQLVEMGLYSAFVLAANLIVRR